ncbi:MAG: hypothetical protein WD065_08415, partial [Planctomycetaceae bacterium]
RVILNPRHVMKIRNGPRANDGDANFLSHAEIFCDYCFSFPSSAWERKSSKLPLRLLAPGQ